MKSKARLKIRLGIVVFAFILLSLLLTYHLSDIENNAIDRVFNTTNMLAFIGFTLALYIFVNDMVIKLKENVKNRECDDMDKEKSIMKIKNCHKEITDDLLFLFIMMILVFAIEVLKDMRIAAQFSKSLCYGTVTVNTFLFFAKCMTTFFSLYVVYDIFGATMKLSKISLS